MLFPPQIPGVGVLVKEIPIEGGKYGSMGIYYCGQKQIFNVRVIDGQGVLTNYPIVTIRENPSPYGYRLELASVTEDQAASLYNTPFVVATLDHYGEKLRDAWGIIVVNPQLTLKAGSQPRGESSGSEIPQFAETDERRYTDRTVDGTYMVQQGGAIDTDSHLDYANLNYSAWVPGYDQSIMNVRAAENAQDIGNMKDPMPYHPLSESVTPTPVRAGKRRRGF